MANFLSNLFTKKNKSVLGIDIGSSSIKMVQLSKKNGHPVLDTYGELSLGQYAGKNIGEATNLPPEKIMPIPDAVRSGPVVREEVGTISEPQRRTRAAVVRARTPSNSAASAARSRTSEAATLSCNTWPVGVVSPGR